MSYIYPNWPSPEHITAFTTTRTLGLSKTPFEFNNLALHVGDCPSAVNANRKALAKSLGLQYEPIWLEQTHSNRCIVVEEEQSRIADAAITRQTQCCLAILTADCLPILLCNSAGTEIAAIHAGWRGLAEGIIENSILQLHSPAKQLMAWIGPAICQNCFIVGKDVFDAYQTRYPSFAAASFRSKGKKFLADLPRLAEQILNSQGICDVFHSNMCTFEQKNSCYSYRRELQTGRMATIIYSTLRD